MTLISSIAEKANEFVTELKEHPDAIKYLEAQHREVEALFLQLEELGDRAFVGHSKIFEEIAHKLTNHAKVEEAVFYPEGENVDKDLTLEAFEEHDVIKHMIAKIKKTGPEDRTYMSKVTVLREIVEHHVKEEENELFPKARKKFSNEHLKDLGAAMKEKFEKLEAQS